MPSIKDAYHRVKSEWFKTSGELASEAKTIEDEPIGEIVFTGTGLNYARKMLQRGQFSTRNGSVYLTNRLAEAYNYAFSRNIKSSTPLDDEPIVIVIDGTREDLRLHRQGIQKDIVSGPITRDAIIAAYRVTGISKGDIATNQNALALLQEKGEEVQL